MAGTASVRSVTVIPVTGLFDLIPAPDGIQAGDMLVAIVSSRGALADITIEGGSPWVDQDERGDGTEWCQTRVLTQVAGSDNPTTYAVTVQAGHSALVMLAHLRTATPNNLLIVSNGGGSATSVPAPDASPGVAGGVELRYALAGSAFFPVFWSSSGYPVEDSGAADLDLSAIVAAQVMLSSVDLPVRAFTSAFAVDGWQTWTLVITPGDYVPPPPPTPAFTPAKGSARYRYTAHDLLTGAYIDDLYPTDVTYDKRIGEPGAFTGTLPVPNRRVAAAVRRVIPKVKSDLSTGPGRVEIRIWRDGVLQPRYWLTGARVQRGRDGKISVALRGSTLDAYFASVRVREDLEFTGDQVSNVRQLLQHAQAQPGANLGILFASGTSGVIRDPLVVKKSDGTTYGRAGQEYARTSGGFESTLIEVVGATGVESVWTWGYPKLGLNSTTRHVFTESPHGGEIAEWAIEIDALRGGTDWEARGGTPETDAAEERTPVYSEVVTTPHRAAGWPRLDRLIDHPTQSTDQTTLDDYAQYWAEAAGGALWVRSVTVFLGKHPSLTMNSLGDQARQVMSNVWYEREDGGAGLDISERIIGIAIRPTYKGVGKEEAQLILESEAVT